MTLDSDLAKAQKLVEKWQTKADTARAEAEQLDRDAGAAILDDPGAAERLTMKIAAKEREARAYFNAAAEARERVTGVYRKHLEAEQRELAKVARETDAAVERHEKKLDTLLDQLRELEGVEYEPGEGTTAGTVMMMGRPVEATHLPTSKQLENEAVEAAVRLHLVEMYLEHNRLPTFGENGFRQQVTVERPPVLARVIAEGITF